MPTTGLLPVPLLRLALLPFPHLSCALLLLRLSHPHVPVALLTLARFNTALFFLFFFYILSSSINWCLVSQYSLSFRIFCFAPSFLSVQPPNIRV